MFLKDGLSCGVVGLHAWNHGIPALALAPEPLHHPRCSTPLALRQAFSILLEKYKQHKGYDVRVKKKGKIKRKGEEDENICVWLRGIVCVWCVAALDASI